VTHALAGWLGRINRRAPVGDLVLILVLGLAPLLWFREEKLLNSEDLMVPPNWDEFTQFWYVWNDQLGTGAQKILDSGRFPTLFIAAALQGLGVGLVGAQMAQFVFWFTIPGFSMYYLMARVYRGDQRRLVRMSAVLFYMFNLWLISNWLGYKEPMIAAVAVMPFLIGLWVRAFSGDTGYLRAVLISALISLAAAPIGNNVSEMILAILPVPLLFLTVLLAAAARRRWPALGRVLMAGLSLSIVLPLLHAFWIVPEIAGIKAAQAADSFPEFQRTSRQFLEGQSLYTSIANNIRLVSDWTWYQGLVDPYRTYAARFAGSMLLGLLGLTTFAMVLLGAIRGRGKYKGYFVLLTGIGLIAGAGLNSPFGPAYAWAVDNLPFFWIIRSPWFKFSFLTVIGYAVLIGLSAPTLVRFAEFVLVRVVGIWSNRVAARGAVFCAFALYFAAGPLYAYPLTFGLAFPTAGERTFLNPNHAGPPTYVYEAADWINRQPSDFRIMTIPGDSPWLNEWGYTGFGSFLQTLTTHPVVFKRSTESTKVSQGAPNTSERLVERIEADLLDERSETAPALLSRLGVRYLVHERDVRYDFYQGSGYRITDSPENVERILANAPGVIRVATFGQWDIYEIDAPRPRFTITSEITAVTNLDARRVALLASPAANPNTVFVDSEDLPPAAESLLTGYASDGRISSGRLDLQSILFTDTSDLEGSVRAAAPGLSIGYGDPTTWGQFDDLTPGHTWRWFTLNNGEHYLASNEFNTPVLAELSLSVFSYARARSFYVYLNSELLSVTEVPPDTPTAVRVPDLRIHPGENVISFYSPYPADPRGGQNAAFAVRRDPGLSRAIFEWRPAVPSGEYRLQATLRPFGDLDWPGGRPNPLVIVVDGRETTMDLQEGSISQFGTTVQLTGTSAITIPQLGQEHYFLELIPDSVQQSPPEPGTATVLRASPTGYSVDVNCDSPCVLVFNESFHEQWVASAGGRPLPHFQVDDFANAYLIEPSDNGLLEIRFQPQGWFSAAVVVSAITTAVTALALVIVRRRKDRDPAGSRRIDPPPTSGQEPSFGR
jgi:hypothetical protein